MDGEIEHGVQFDFDQFKDDVQEVCKHVRSEAAVVA